MSGCCRDNDRRRDFEFDAKIKIDRDDFCRAVDSCIEDLLDRRRDDRRRDDRRRDDRRRDDRRKRCCNWNWGF